MDFGHGEAVRRLGETAVAEGHTYLQYDAGFVARGVNPPPIRLRLHTGLQKGVRDLEGLPGLLHDSLPNGWPRLVLDRELRNPEHDHTSLTPIDRLALVGTDGSGALTYTGRRLEAFEASAGGLRYRRQSRGQGSRGGRWGPHQDALTLTGSLGGARPKADVWRQGDACATSNSLGAKLWLAKFPAKGDGRDVGAVEYAYSLMAKAAGIDMPPTALLPSKQTAGYFAIQRFDCTETGGRLRMHSLGGLLNASSATSTHG